MKRFFLSALTFVFFSSAAWAGFSADMLIETAMSTRSGRIYFQDPHRVRTEMDNMLTIMNSQDVFYVFEKTKKYVQEDVQQPAKANPLAGIRNFDRFMAENGLQKTGQESLEGFACEIHEGNVQWGGPFKSGEQSAYLKIWYARELDYSLKTETTLPEPMGRVVTRLASIKTGNQPDSLFEVPDGYARAENMQEAMGLDHGRGINLDMEGMSENMPGSEEMEEFKKKMQEMLQDQN